MIFAWSCILIIRRDWLSPILRKNSRSLIIHENVFFWEENNFSKKNLNFFGQMVFGFRKNILRTTTGENLRKILRAVLEICDRLQINFFVSKFKNFFSKSPNDSIRKVNWLKLKSEYFLWNLPTTGGHRPSLRNFSTKNENKVLGHFIDFGWFDMSDMVFSDR